MAWLYSDSRLGRLGFLRQDLAGQLHFQILVVGLRGLQLPLGIERFLLQLRIAHLENTVSGFTAAPANQDAIHTSFGDRRNPTDILRDQRPRPRTWRNIGPRFTVSTQTVDRSTVGAAGLSLDKPMVTKPIRITPAVT